MPNTYAEASAQPSMPGFKFSEEAREFLLEATYGRGFPRATDASQIPLALWTLNTSQVAADGSTIAEFGPRYQLFVGSLSNVTSEFLVELDAGKSIAFRLDPTIRQAASYFVSLDNNRLNIQPGDQ